MANNVGTPVLDLTPKTLIELVGIALESPRTHGKGFVLLEGETLAFVAEGQTLRLADSEALLASSPASAQQIVHALNADPALLITLAQAANLVSPAELGADFQAGFMAAHSVPVGQAFDLKALSDAALTDGLRSHGIDNQTTLLNHLHGLDENLHYFSVALDLKTFTNLFGRVNAGVGVDLYHLPPLPDEDYANGIDPTVFSPIDDGVRSVAVPVTEPDAFTGAEDTQIVGDLSLNDDLPNLGATYQLVGPGPTDGTLVLNPDGSFTFDPNPDFSGDVVFEYELVDPASDTITVEAVTLTVTPVADIPSATATNVVTEEDTPVALVGLSAVLEDTDGSETLTTTITGVPVGATLSTGTEIAPGVWQIDPAQIGNVTFTPPADWHGVIDLSLNVTSTESDGTTALTTVPFTVTVDAQADMPDLSPGSATVNEDETVVFGPGITFAATDTDGSEAVTEVVISGFPPGSTPVFASVPGATVTPSGDGFVITGTEAGIQAVVASFGVTPPPESGDDFDLTVAVTVTDADGSTATTTSTLPVDVVPVADTPVLTGGSYVGDEDTPVPLTALSGITPDTDGSETIAFEIAGVPAGTSLSVGTDLGGGVWSLTPAELAVVAFNPGLHFHGTVPFVLTATTTDSNGDTATAST
ncbi:MAG: Ig-like domain-containing protein, partial [Pseudomonadota bacterium]